MQIMQIMRINSLTVALLLTGGVLAGGLGPLATRAADAAPSYSTARKRPPPPPPREAGDAPVTSLPDALTRAQAYVRAHKIDTSRQYLQAVTFDFVARRWTVTWQVPRAKGGVTMVLVPEQGEPSVSYGE
jgi:hypothetical protein